MVEALMFVSYTLRRRLCRSEDWKSRYQGSVQSRFAPYLTLKLFSN